MNVYESLRGGMYVVERPSDREFIQKRLKELDPSLFIQKEIGLDKQEVWVVYADAWPPVPILEWRDDRGQPIHHLTENIIYRIAQMPRESGKLMKQVLESNAALQERKANEHNEEMGELFRDMLPRIWGRGRILAPRGQKLYQQRNRLRARGEL